MIARRPLTLDEIEARQRVARLMEQRPGELRRWPETADDPGGLKAMVSYGIEQFDRGKCKGLHFRVFSAIEAERVSELMAARPEIPFSYDRIA